MKNILMLIASLCVIHSALAMDVNPNTGLLYKEIQSGNLAKVQAIIRDCTTQEERNQTTNAALRMAASFGPINILKFLLESGADVNAARANGLTLLMIATLAGDEAKIIEILAHIPLSERENIRHSIVALGLIKRKQNLYLDSRKLITNKIIAQLVKEQMPRINQLLAQTTPRGTTARDIALGNDRLIQSAQRPNIAQLLDLTSPESQKIRAAIEKNIRRILFGPQNQ